MMITPYSTSLVPQVDELLINKKDDFFISIAKQDMHSFVMLGVMKDDGPKMLLRVGKWIKREDALPACYYLTKAVFTDTQAHLKTEPLTPFGTLSYAAYSIQYQHYLQFIDLLGVVGDLSCYQPDREQGDEVILVKKPFPQAARSATHDQDILVETIKSLNAKHNSCRHTAIDLIKHCQGVSDVRASISKQFFRNLPLTDFFYFGKPRHHFYIFPCPPNAFKADEKKMILLTTIYQRMESLLKKDPFGAPTLDKFNALKSLYNQLSGQLNADLSDILTSILAWKSDHMTSIRQLRKQSFFGRLFVSKSSTEQMTEALIKMTSPTQGV